MSYCLEKAHFVVHRLKTYFIMVCILGLTLVAMSSNTGHPRDTPREVPVQVHTASAEDSGVLLDPGDPVSAFFQFMSDATPEEQASFYISQLFPPSLSGRFEKMLRVCENPARGDPSPHPALYVRAVSPTHDHGTSQINISWKSTFEKVTGQPWNPGIYDPYWNVYFANWLNDQTSHSDRTAFNQWSCQWASR